MPLYRLLYQSEMDLQGSAADVRAIVTTIVQASREANRRAELTGALVHVGSTFIQVLEGPVQAVEATFERICCDLRHRHVELLEFAAAAERSFGAWSMAEIFPKLGLQQIFSGLEVEMTSTDAVPAQTIIRVMRSML